MYYCEGVISIQIFIAGKTSLNFEQLNPFQVEPKIFLPQCSKLLGFVHMNKENMVPREQGKIFQTKMKLHGKVHLTDLTLYNTHIPLHINSL